MAALSRIGAVDDDAAQAALDHLRDHQLADDGVGQVAAGVHHEDVARPGEADRLVDHQVVARAGLHRQGGAGEHAAGVHGPQPRAAGRHARHAVADVRDRQVAEARDHLRPDRPGARQDPEPCCHLLLLRETLLAGPPLLDRRP
jgi:hypothetical protein